MKKTAFIFPGQGSQYVGMGRDFYERYACARRVIDIAEDVSGLDLRYLLFEENQEIHKTRYTQICMLADEIAILKVMEECGLFADVHAGLSLGEYGALAASGVLTLRDAFSLITKRGRYMEEAVPEGGAMTAVIGLSSGKIEKICEETPGIVSVANYNCPGQTVITGEAAAVSGASAACKEAGAKRCVELKVSGPFHSKMLIPAGEKLAEALSDVEIGAIRVPYISNVTADYVTDTDEIKGLLARQVSSPVRWQQSVERMIADGVDTFIEIGPGKSLSGFMRKIDKEKTSYHVDKLEDLEKLREVLGF